MKRAAHLLSTVGQCLWRLPSAFDLVNVLGRDYGVRCVLFHDVADQRSAFTDGLKVTIDRAAFERAISFVAEHYEPVTLDFFQTVDRRGVSKKPPILVTFDDAYATVAENAAPICQKYGVPAVFFLNASLVDNRDLSLENFLTYLRNTQGPEPIRTVAARIAAQYALREDGFEKGFGRFVSQLSMQARKHFKALLSDLMGVDPRALAQQAGLYVTSEQVRGLSRQGFEFGNHTYSHVFGRSLEAADFPDEIGRNVTSIKELTGAPVRAFSVPFGSAMDLPPSLADYLAATGHETVFLVESLINKTGARRRPIYRVSVSAKTHGELFSELEFLPRLRTLGSSLRAKSG
jgi:peptidoglycan/xylan/chitin deacetylase (PgdA/CDA1 family)